MSDSPYAARPWVKHYDYWVRPAMTYPGRPLYEVLATTAVEIPDAPAYLLAWGPFPLSQRAAALSLIGDQPITGIMPVSIPPLLPLGAGLQRAAARR